MQEKEPSLVFTCSAIFVCAYEVNGLNSTDLDF